MNEMQAYIAQQVADSPPPTQTGGQSKGIFDHFGLLILGGSFLFMYFLMIRPRRQEEKRKQEMLASLKKGDTVLTTSGMIATVSSIKTDKVFLNIGDGTRVEFLRSSISQIYTETPSAIVKAKSKKK